MYLLGIDLGTTGCKSMIFSYTGDILGGDYIEYDLIIDDTGHIEQSADTWWHNVKASVKKAVSDSGIDGKKIKALSISSQGISVVPVDRHGNTLMNAISWLDRRAEEEASSIRDTFGALNIFSSTGKQARSSYVLPKLMWIKKNLPDIYKNTWKFMMGLDFLIYRFCGSVLTDYSMASGTLAYDITEKAWTHGVLSRFDIDCQKLPELGCLGDAAGKILPSVAEELGLSNECLIVLGAQDQRCASFGAGIDKGIATVSLGTATAVCSICSQPVTDQNMNVTSCGLDEKQWMLESVVRTSGVALKWVKNTFFKSTSYGEMDALAEASAHGSHGVMFYPYLQDCGDGAKGAFAGLGLHVSAGDIIRSVFEGIAYQIKMHIQAHEAINGTMKQIRLFGGGAKSGIWANIIADVTGITVSIPRTHETGNLGAAMIAGIGAGIYSGYDDALKAAAGTDAKTFIPDTEAHEKYEGYFKNYCNLNEKLL